MATAMKLESIYFFKSLCKEHIYSTTSIQKIESRLRKSDAYIINLIEQLLNWGDFFIKYLL